MTFSATDPGASDLLQRVRQRLVDVENQLRGHRNTGWKPDALRLINEEVGRLHSAADRVQPDIAEAMVPLLGSLRAALSAPSMPSTTQWCDVPSPTVKRPPHTAWTESTSCAIAIGCRVWIGSTAVPSSTRWVASACCSARPPSSRPSTPPTSRARPTS